MALLEKHLKIDLPLDSIDLHILLAISSTPLDSYRILQFVSAQSTLEIGLQTVYTHIKLLLKNKWIRRVAYTVNDGNPRRELYQLSPFGKHVLQAEIERLETLVKHAYVVGVMDN